MKLNLLAFFTLFLNFSVLSSQNDFSPPERLLFVFEFFDGNDRFCLEDFNGDGNLDILAGGDGYMRYLDENLNVQDSFLLNNGSVNPIAIMDFNGDGKNDIFYFLDWYENISDEEYVEHSIGSYGSYYQKGDFNNDGKLDFLKRTDFGDLNNFIYLSLNSGGADIDNHYIEFAPTNSSFVDDLNADGFSDFVLLEDSLFLRVFINQQDTTFLEDTIHLSLNEEDTRRYTVVKHTNIDNDQKRDIVLMGADNYLAWLSGLGEGQYEPIQHYYLSNSPALLEQIKGFDLIDFNGDWRKDIVVMTEKDNVAEIYIVWNSENGFLEEAEHIYSMPNNYSYPIREKEDDRILGKDIDRDNKPDIVFHIGKEIFWMKNNFLGTFNAQIEATRLAINPNPFRDYLNLSFSENLNSDKVLLRLTDINGTVFLQQKTKLPFTLERLDRLPGGVYYISIFDESNQRLLGTKKIVKK